MALALRLALLAALCAGFAVVGAPKASALDSTGSFFVGADEDDVKWGRGELAVSVARALGLKALRVTVPWRRGETRVAGTVEQELSRSVVGAWGLRLVVSVYGAAADTPRTEEERTAFCDFVADLVRRYPTVNDVGIWLDPNDGAFWSPQVGPDGSSVAPADYAALLARCWTALHSVRATVNLIAPSVSLEPAKLRPPAPASHAPATWWRKLGAAYRATGRQAPLFDTVGHIPHPDHSAERPWARHSSSSLGEGDYGKLVSALRDAFQGTGQPLPGQGSVSIWYLAHGFETLPDQSKARLYSGRESRRSPVPALALGAKDLRRGGAPDQATQLVDALKVAYCQPGVGAVFNFLLADEQNLGGWQSGLLWADWTPKPSYPSFRRAVAEVASRSVNCAAFGKGGVPPRPALVRPSEDLRILGLHTTRVTAFGATVAFRTTIPAKVRLAYGSPAAGPAMWTEAQGSGLERQARLHGLAHATTYRIWVTASSDDGQRAQAALDVRTQGVPARPTASTGNGNVLLDGEPFFPLMVWSQCPNSYAANLAAGINLFAENPCGGLQVQLDSLGGRAFSAAVAGKDAGHGHGLIGFFYPDEPDGLNMPASAFPPPPAFAPKLAFLTLTNHFFSGAAPLPWDVNRLLYPPMIAKSDVIGFDLYPLQEWCRPERLVDVWSSQQELVALSGGKPTFQWIETTSWRCPGGRTEVTPAAVKAESWLAIAGGARGLGFFPSDWHPAVGRAIGDVSRDIAKLQPALLGPSIPVTVDHPVVRGGARVHDGSLYVIAVNAGFVPAEARITLPGLENRIVHVWDEGRKLVATGGSFVDTFEPLGVHVYVMPLPER